MTDTTLTPAPPAPPALSDSRKKSFDLTIDSLKLYITMATFAFGWLLAIYNSLKDPIYTALFYLSIFSFFGCAIVSVYTINMFITETYKERMDPMAGVVRKPNVFAILLFVSGFIFGGFFMALQKNTSVAAGQKIQIELTDSAHHSKTYTIQVKSVQ